MANARGYSPYQRMLMSNQPHRINRRLRRGVIPTQASLIAARVRAGARGRGTFVAVHKPGSRPPTRTGVSLYVGPRKARQIRIGSSRRIKGASVQNRRQTPKTYI